MITFLKAGKESPIKSLNRKAHGNKHVLFFNENYVFYLSLIVRLTISTGLA